MARRPGPIEDATGDKDKPLFDLPDFPHPDSELLIGSPYPAKVLNCDPWVFSANTPDMQHLKFVHRMKISGEDPHDKLKWDPFGFIDTYKGFDPGEVHISVDRFAHRIRGRQLSAERNGNKRLRFVREILK